MAHKAGHGRSGALTKSFKSSVKTQKAKIAAGTAYASRSKDYHVQAAKRAVQKSIGLTGMSYGPAGQKFATNTVAAKLTGKDQKFYGIEASAAIDKYLQSAGLADGNLLSSTGYEVKHGSYTPGKAQTPEGMGSGNPKGALTSIPISKEMLQSQNKFLGLAKAGISFAMPGLAKTVIRADAAKNLYDAANPQEAYNQYEKKFSAKLAGRQFTPTRNLFGLINIKQTNKTKKDTLG